MHSKTLTFEPKKYLKATWWILVALYTFILPDFYIIYRNIVTFFGQDAAGKVPVLIVAVLGIVYSFTILFIQKNPKNLLYLVPCGVIALLILTLVSNPNKHIHIPEYVLMTWLLYAALSKDHKGKGLFILIFIYASLLGVVDELEQGIHPSRFYGLSDMLVNCASALIGVFTIMGLKKMTIADWSWTTRLMDFKGLLGLSLFGFIGAVLMCIALFQVQARLDFWSVYPIWLWIWNILFLILSPVIIAHYNRNLHKYHQIKKDKKKIALPDEVKTARLWVFPLLVILLFMHGLVLYVSISGVKFV
jgi:VanZ family protein